MQQLTLELLRDILLEAEFLAEQVTQTAFSAFIQDELNLSHSRPVTRLNSLTGTAGGQRWSAQPDSGGYQVRVFYSLNESA